MQLGSPSGLDAATAVSVTRPTRPHRWTSRHHREWPWQPGRRLASWLGQWAKMEYFKRRSHQRLKGDRWW